MAAPVVGIDLGTTNSVVAVAQGGEVVVLADKSGNKLTPSVVSYHPSGQVLVGQRAADRRIVDPTHTIYSVKRLIGRPFDSDEVRTAQKRFAFDLMADPKGGGVLVMLGDKSCTLSEISAFVLRQVRKVAEEALGETCVQAVITVPANFNELQRSATKAAGRVAGLDVLRMLNEPTAAAVAYGYGQGTKNERIAVFDFGGGTFDITILELSGEVLEVRATAGDTYLGGDDIDQTIADDMATTFLKEHRFDPRTHRHVFERLRTAAEWAKCQLSDKEEVELCVEELATGPGGKPLDLNYRLKRSELETSVKPIVARTFDVCEKAMEAAGIRPTQLDNVVLVGGSTRMPLVRNMVSEYFGRAAFLKLDPDLVVAMGAAIQGRALTAPEQRVAGKVQVGGGGGHARYLPPSPTALLGKVKLKRAAEKDAAKDEKDEEDRTSVERPLPLPPAKPAARKEPDGDDEDRTAVERMVMAPGRLPLPPLLPRIAGPKPPAVPPPVPPPIPDKKKSAAQGPAVLFDEPSEELADLPQLPQLPAAPAPVAASAKRALVHEEVEIDVADGPAVLFEASPEVAAALPPMPEPKAPLLLDVTPHTLSIETVGGLCEPVIVRNSTIPVDKSRLFSTAQDNQEMIRTRICQGESRTIEGNEFLGEIELVGLKPGPRGKAEILVNFIIDADGTLRVLAKDKASGKEHTVRINLAVGLDEGRVREMAQQHEQMTII